MVNFGAKLTNNVAFKKQTKRYYCLNLGNDRCDE